MRRILHIPLLLLLPMLTACSLSPPLDGLGDIPILPTASPPVAAPAPSPGAPVSTATPTSSLATPTTPAVLPFEDLLSTPAAGGGKGAQARPAPACITSVHGDLARAWQAVAADLGCPTSAGEKVWSADQLFERGYTFWRSDRRRIYILYNGGRYQTFDDAFEYGQPESDPTFQPPSGLYQPIRGFGKVWREHADVRDGLGWATAKEKGYNAAVQDFEHGLIFWARAQNQPVVLVGGTWCLGWPAESH